eukprot:COSAG02_NODE_3_length_74588_cov_108.368430_9_plen_175_part_00
MRGLVRHSCWTHNQAAEVVGVRVVSGRRPEVAIRVGGATVEPLVAETIVSQRRVGAHAGRRREAVRLHPLERDGTTLSAKPRANNSAKSSDPTRGQHTERGRGGGGGRTGGNKASRGGEVGSRYTAFPYPLRLPEHTESAFGGGRTLCQGDERRSEAGLSSRLLELLCQPRGQA